VERSRALDSSWTGPLKLRLRGGGESAWALRDRLHGWLGEAGVETPDQFAVILAAVEAFTNAVEHSGQASSSVDVDGTFGDGRVTISIRDYGTWKSEQSLQKEDGLGLAIIDVLMDGVRVDRQVDGTTVTMSRRLAAN
jgi:anti-sigma regulatory factor (Ser/Thr protein kinase)